MRVHRIFFVHLTEANRHVSLAAGRAAFPDADAVEAANVTEAARWRGRRRPCLLVLGEPDEAAASEAIQATDASGRPRWAVVILGRDGGELAEAVPPEDWNVPLLARVFRSAVLQHELLLENTRLRGDLRTVAHRIRHDLNSPVGCVWTSAQVLELLPERDAATIAAMIENIKASSQEITLLIDRISLVLRAAADPPPPTWVEMEDAVTAARKQLAPEIQRTGATVATAGDWPAVKGVGPWLQAIWWNLLGNALRHGGPAPRVQLGWRPMDDGNRFFVSNTRAPGAPPLAVGLFRPFELLHELRLPGLGLAIVKRLVESQGGRCGCDTRADGAAEFHFTLPAGTPPRHPLPEDAAEMVKLGR